MRAFHHVNAVDLDGAIGILAEQGGKARVTAGGSDLFGLLKDEFLPEHPEVVVNLKEISGLDYIREENGGLKIGPLTRLSDLCGSPFVKAAFPALAEAAYSVATPQIRNVATLGGNLCQDVRCCYYRYPRHLGGPIQCARKGSGPCLAVTGDHRYHAIMQGRKCFAVCPSDTAVALALFDAELVVVGPQGERLIPVSDFYTPLGNRLEKAEVVREIRIPAPPVAARQGFHKFTLRRPIDFAVASVATVVAETGGVCSEARIALGAVAPGIVRAAEAEEFLKGKVVDEKTAGAAAALAVAGARPFKGNAYKVEIVKALVKRALMGEKPQQYGLEGEGGACLHRGSER